MTGLLVLTAVVALAGLPLFLVLSVLALAGFSSQDLPHTIYFAELLRLAGNPTLVAIPLFTLGGYVLAESRAPQRLVRLARALLGWLPGGLAVVAVLVMALLTAFTGASGVTIVALGGLMLPALLKGGFSEKFGLGLLTASGSVGLLFPPSLPLILYGVVAGTPIDRLFIAGVAPGLLMVSGVIIYSVWQGTRIRQGSKPLSEPVLPALREAIWELPLPIVVVGGIYGGMFTATEAAVVTVVYILLVELLITRDVRIAELPRILTESAILVGGILLILGAALALTNYMVYADVPTNLLGWIKSTLHSRLGFLIALNLFLLVVGCLMDIFSALVVVVPLILPLATQYGVDPIHLGIIFLANLEIGYSTPPVGLNLFIASFRFQKPILDLYRATVPFLLIRLAVLALITYVPAITLAPLEWMVTR